MPRKTPTVITAASVALARVAEEHLDAAVARLGQVPDADREAVAVVLAASLVRHAVEASTRKRRALAGLARTLSQAADAAGYTIALEPEPCDCPRCRAAREADDEGAGAGPTIQ